MTLVVNRFILIGGLIENMCHFGAHQGRSVEFSMSLPLSVVVFPKPALLWGKWIPRGMVVIHCCQSQSVPIIVLPPN